MEMNDSLSREPVLAEVEKRFRLVPNFFVSTPDAPEVIEKLWDFARAAYLDNPMPTLFKERLFVFLSRFCPVRYCLVRHCGFLVGYGHSSGDPHAKLQTIDQVIKLLATPPPWHRSLDSIYQRLEAIKEPFEWPEPDSDAEDGMFAAATLIFVEPGKSERARHSLRQALGAKRFEYLLAFLAFVRTAHFWTMVHPELELEGDVKELVSRNPELGFLLLHDPEVSGSKLTLSTELGNIS
jgi:hypothetical protein